MSLTGLKWITAWLAHIKDTLWYTFRSQYDISQVVYIIYCISQQITIYRNLILPIVSKHRAPNAFESPNEPDKTNARNALMAPRRGAQSDLGVLIYVYDKMMGPMSPMYFCKWYNWQCFCFNKKQKYTKCLDLEHEACK